MADREISRNVWLIEPVGCIWWYTWLRYVWLVQAEHAAVY